MKRQIRVIMSGLEGNKLTGKKKIKILVHVIFLNFFQPFNLDHFFPAKKKRKLAHRVIHVNQKCLKYLRHDIIISANLTNSSFTELDLK